MCNLIQFACVLCAFSWRKTTFFSLLQWDNSYFWTILTNYTAHRATQRPQGVSAALPKRLKRQDSQRSQSHADDSQAGDILNVAQGRHTSLDTHNADAGRLGVCVFVLWSLSALVRRYSLSFGLFVGDNAIEIMKRNLSVVWLRSRLVACWYHESIQIINAINKSSGCACGKYKRRSINTVICYYFHTVLFFPADYNIRSQIFISEIQGILDKNRVKVYFTVY